jgi:dienelactone hydrolase
MNNSPWIVALVRTCGRRIVAASAVGLISAASALAVDEALVARFTPWFMPPLFSNPKLSPGGEYLGFELRDGDNCAIGVYAFATGSLSISSPTGKFVPADYWWKGPQRLIVRFRREDLKERSVTAFDFDGKNVEDLWHIADLKGRIVDALPDDPKHVLVAYSNEVHRVNINTGISEKVTPELGLVSTWLIDSNYNVRAAYKARWDGTRDLWWWQPGGGKARHMDIRPADPGFRPFAVDRDPRFLWVWDFTDNPNVRLSKFDMESGTLVPVFGGAGEHPSSTMILGRTGIPVAATYPQTEPLRIEPLDESIRPAIDLLRDKFAGYVTSVVDDLPDGKTWIVRAESSRFPGGYFLFDRESGKVTPVAARGSPSLKEHLFVPSRRISVRSREGGEINGRLWLPREAKKPPVVVMCPNGFPSMPSDDKFDANVQALCDQGFAVAQFDGRGTVGYGREFELLGSGSIPQLLREDYEAGVAGLAEQGLVDGDRAALLGFRVGGALAIAVGEASTKFRAVVSINAPDKIERDNLIHLTLDSSMKVLSDRVGGWRQSAEVAKSISPIDVAPRLRIPSLHLFNDEPWKPGKLSEDARRLQRAMKSAGSPAQVGLAHGWHRGLTPPSAEGRDGATIAVKVIEFLGSSMGK